MEHKSMMEPRFDKARHIKYWTRCIKTLLPSQYTGTESNRMYLAFLMLSALDLLGCLTTVCSAEERRDYIDWIYRCQHPDGGFRMWPGTDFGAQANAENARWDPANVPATYFALAALLTLDDDLKRVRRRQTLKWLRGMQREDGSFGETLVDGKLEGGRDPRFGYCAMGVRYILRGYRKGPIHIEGKEEEDVNVDSLVQCIRAAESFDGGIADEPLHEPHAGYTFCSLGALAFTDRLSTTSTQSPQDPIRAPSNPREVVRWLVYRQTELTDPDAALDADLIGLSIASPAPFPNPTAPSGPTPPLHQSPDKSLIPLLTPTAPDCLSGMNGRPNKVADTCYAWWAGASLHLLNQAKLYDHAAVRRYLLEKTQHPVLGGFGKFPGDLPDLYHSCLGLAALSLASGEGVGEVDAGMCISAAAKGRLGRLWEGWEREELGRRLENGNGNSV